MHMKKKEKKGEMFREVDKQTNERRKRNKEERRREEKIGNTK